jgi:peptidoglycan/LPS O-acetylase OafA/YrhL
MDKNRSMPVGLKPETHMPQLDGLRAIAALIIVYVHWIHHGDLFGTPWGDIGVQLFFVLSGFLITGILLKAREIPEQSPLLTLRQFYIRRALRIFPLFYATIAILVLFNVPHFRETWPWHAAYLSNIYFYQNGFGGPGGHFWTLAVEEQFYLLFPVLLLLAPRKALVPLIVACLASAPIYRYASGSGLIGDPKGCYWLQLPASLDSLAYGAALAWMRKHLTVHVYKRLVTAILLLSILTYGASHLFNWFGDIKKTCVALILGWIVALAGDQVKGVTGRVLESRILSEIGKRSYGLYVIHAFAPSIWIWLMYHSPIPGYRIALRLGIPESFFGNWYFEKFAWTLLTAFLTYVSFRFLENPLNQLKSSFPYRMKQLVLPIPSSTHRIPKGNP